MQVLLQGGAGRYVTVQSRREQLSASGRVVVGGRADSQTHRQQQDRQVVAVELYLAATGRVLSSSSRPHHPPTGIDPLILTDLACLAFGHGLREPGQLSRMASKGLWNLRDDHYDQLARHSIEVSWARRLWLTTLGNFWSRSIPVIWRQCHVRVPQCWCCCWWC